MIVVVGLLMFMVALYIVGMPFLRKEEKAPRRAGRRVAVAAEGQDPRYAMRREIEAEYAAGVISKQEYEEMQTAEGQAARGSEATGGAAPAPVHDAIEEKVRQIRGQKAPGAASPAAQRPAVKPQVGQPGAVGQTPSKGRMTCPKCGQAYREGDRFCTGCGTALKAGGRG